LKNGIEVIMEKRELPIVALSITNKFGASSEKSEIKGVAHVIEHLLFTGTKTRTHEDISRSIEKKGGILNAFTSNEMTSFWFKLPSEHVFIGLEILADMLNNPLFDNEKFEKEKKVILEEIKMYHDDPAIFIFEQLEGNLYEKPFGETVIGNEKSVSSLTREKVYRFFKENYNPSNYVISIVGNVDFKKVCDFIEKKFSKNESKVKTIQIKKKNEDSYEERPGIDQAHFVIGMHAPLSTEKGHYVLEVLDAYLANGMSSRLFLEIREKRGLAYAVRSNIQSEKSYSYYCIYAGTRKDKIEEVKKIILEELEKINSMVQSDLEEAKERLIGLRKITKEESVNVMNALMTNELSGKAEDYYLHEEKIKEVRLDEVKKLAKELLKKYSTAAIVPK